MKLPIRDEFFEQIKSGKKEVEYRDAHITFVNEKTKETITKPVIGVCLRSKIMLPKILQKSGMFDDETIIQFLLG